MSIWHWTPAAQDRVNHKICGGNGVNISIPTIYLKACTYVTYELTVSMVCLSAVVIDVLSCCCPPFTLQEKRSACIHILKHYQKAIPFPMTGK